MIEAEALQAVVPINLASHILIFAGSGYALLHARQLPRWHLTPLWYVGLGSLAAAISILLGLIMGDGFALAYARIGVLLETAVNVALGLLAATMLYHVIRADIAGRKRRATGSSASVSGRPAPPPAVRQSRPRKRVRAGARTPTA